MIENDLGLVLAKWDEDTGPENIAVYPEDFIEDPDVIALQCFSSSQFIFGGKEFNQISFGMPLVYLKIEANLYFDFLIDENVRGGRTPILLILLYNENTHPRSAINQFESIIFEKLQNIKANIDDISIIKEKILEFHEYLNHNLSNFEHSKAFQVLKDSEARFRTFFEDARDAICIFDPKTNIIIDANLAAENLIYRTKKAIIGMTSEQLFFPENEEKFDKIINQHLFDDDKSPVQTNIHNSYGKEIAVEINASIIEVGGKALVQATFRDISKQKNAERYARKMKLYAEKVVNTVRQPILVLNRTFIVLSANLAFQGMFHLLPEQYNFKSLFVIGNNQWDFTEMRILLQDLLINKNQIDEYKIDHIFPDIGHKKLLLEVSRIEEIEDQPAIIIIKINDITHLD